MARLVQLRRSMEAALHDQSVGRAYIYTETVARLQSFIPQFEAALQARSQADAVRRRLMTEANQRLAQLELEVRTVALMVAGQVRRQLASAALLRYYQPSERGNLPVVRKRGEWLTVAEGLLRGDDQARKQGFAGVVTRGALESALTSAREVLVRLNEADQQLSSAQKNFTDLRAEANLLCQHVHADLRNLLRSETPVYRRQVMCTYGLNFEPTPSEEAPIPEPTTVVLPTIHTPVNGVQEGVLAHG
jgi:hypothetical protein